MGASVEIIRFSDMVKWRDVYFLYYVCVDVDHTIFGGHGNLVGMHRCIRLGVVVCFVLC